ncbi:unnamed protein product [Ectocarpus sp. 4 AP-2014]
MSWSTLQSGQQQQQQQHVLRTSRRKPLRTSCGHLLLLVGAALLPIANHAFVPQALLRHLAGAGTGLRSGAKASHSSITSSVYRRNEHRAPPPAKAAAARANRMVLGEVPSAECRRTLQRAWQASSSEARTHEQLEQEQQQCRVAPPAEETARSARESKDAVARGMEFRLTTFNLLAPCYKRMHSEVSTPVGGVGTGLLANRAKGQRTARESEFDGVWRERALETVDFICRHMSSSDIICLQEFWLDPAYHAIFQSALEKDYEFYTVKRTGLKSDGVAVLLRRGKFDVLSQLGLSLSSIGNRVALIMHLRESGAGGGEVGEDMILVNTHLAFPHNALDRVNQMSQIRAVTDTVEGVMVEAGLPTMTPRVVVGDLNVEETDPVCGHLGRNGFRSAFTSLHRERRVITHRNHRGEEVMCDHVFVKAPGFAGRRRGDSVAPATAPEIPGLVPGLCENVSVEEALVLPVEVDAAEWCPNFSLSDHRPLTVRLKFPPQ